MPARVLLLFVLCVSIQLSSAQEKGFMVLFDGTNLDSWIGNTGGYTIEGANNGLGIRTPSKGDAAYMGMELQILDNSAEVYKDLQVYQYHGSVYGVIPALRGYLNPVGHGHVLWFRNISIKEL